MAKSAVYSWRVDPELLGRLEAAARREGRSVAALLEEMALARVERDPSSEDEAEQTALQARVSASIGVLRGGDPDRAVSARQRVRARIASRRAR
jgi:hypothetical protein